MDMMLIAIAAVVIIVIIAAVVMMKKKGGNADTRSSAQKSTNRPKTLAEQQRERELQNQATINISPTPTPQTAIITSTQIPTSPNSADTPSSLAMAGAIAPATAVAAVAAHAMSKPTNNHATPIQPVSGADSINFEDFDIFREDLTPTTKAVEPTFAMTSTTPVPVVTQPATSTATDDLALDFDLDQDSQPHSAGSLSSIANESSMPVTPAVTPIHKTASDDSFLSLEANDDGIYFDLGEAIVPETKPTVTTSEPTITHSANTVADDSFDFDDIDLELPILAEVSNASAETASKAKPVPTPPVIPTIAPIKEDFSDFEDFGEFDLALDTPDKPSLMPNIEPITPITPLSTEAIIKDTTAKNEAIMLDDDFNFDLDDSLFSQDMASTTAPTSTPNPITDTHTKPLMETNTTEPSMTLNGLDDTFDQLDAFYAPTHTVDTHKTASAFVPETVTATQPTLADTHGPVVPTAPLVTSTAPVVTEDFSQAFEVIKDMDSQQVTLELAEQYIQLGEYDSAKRLLSELSTAAPAVQQNANRLMARLV